MKELKQYAKEKGLHLTQEMIGQLETYEKELVAWNQKFNLTTIIKPEDIWHKHFLDSMTVLEAIPEKAVKLIDIGCGAGFPGMVIKILRPELHITLLEATGKKVQFLKHIIETLKLTHIEAINNRAEILAHHPNYRERYDVAVSRAVAMLPTLLEYTIPFLKTRGLFIAQKRQGTEEIKSARTALEALGASYESSRLISSDILPERQLVCIKKNSSTDKQYPRQEGLPKKRPL